MSNAIAAPVRRTPLKAFRETLRFIGDPLNTLGYFQSAYGDIVPLPLPGPQSIQFTHPIQVTQVLKMPIKDATTRSMTDIMGQGLLTGSGPEWRRNRRLISKAFSPRAVKPFFDTILSLASEWTDRLERTSGEVDMTEEMLGLTLDVILRTVFGGAVEMNRDQVARAMEDYFVQFNLDVAGWRTLLPKFIMTPGRRRRARAMRELRTMVHRSIEQRKSAGEGEDLLYFMLQVRDDDGAPIPDTDLCDEALTLILSGHETTAETITYALWSLAHAPELLSRVQAEIDAQIDSCGMQREAVDGCKLLEAVISETMRLYPPAFIVAREAHEDCEIGGLAVKRGAQLLCPAWVIHRDPRWWQSPDEFRPERWLNGETDELPMNAYFPFGGGPRLCVGKHFAAFEARVLLATLLRRLSVKPAPGYELELLPSVTLRPKTGIRLCLEHRAERRRRGGRSIAEPQVVLGGT